MGIQGLLKHLGSGKRTSLAALATQHYAEHQRPLRLGIDIAIWLFQIQATQGGSNPALRTFYYRLLRLISLNIHPLFVFDGPNKPLFKRNKRVGGPGVRVATVPEFLAKQLLKQFGLPMHIAPGEAEAECALLQRQGVIDAVLSDDVDTMMFGSTLTLRNWTTQGLAKTPTHVDVYDASAVQSASGLDTHGMILVALMSGGDYIPEGIPGCGPKIAVDAARAGFGEKLCSLTRADQAELVKWREELQAEFRTNASKYFTRRNTSLVVPSDFPNFEVLGYYTNPCVSGLDRVEELRRTLQWDLPLDLPALRSFAGDAFDWHYRGGAIKFVRNLAPALLVRDLRLSSEQTPPTDEHEQMAIERSLLEDLHGIREHSSTDMATELRVSFVPAKLVPIDMAMEVDEPDAGINASQHDDNELIGAEVEDDDGVPQTPSRRKRAFRPYEEDQAERIWVMREWVQLGCPTMLEDYEAALRAPKPAPVKKARPRTKQTAHRAGIVDKTMQPNALMRHVTMTKTKSILEQNRAVTKPLDEPSFTAVVETISLTSSPPPTQSETLTGPANPDQPRFRQLETVEPPKTPSGRKRPSAPTPTPQSVRSVITDFFSPSAARQGRGKEVIDLLSSSPVRGSREADHTTPRRRPRKTARTGFQTLREMPINAASGRSAAQPIVKAPRKILQKSLTMPLIAESAGTDEHDRVECLDLAEPFAQVHSQQQVRAEWPVAAESSTAVTRRGTVRIRESLEGSWTVESDRSVARSPRQGKTWRLSGIDLLDLTEVDT